MCLNRNSTVGWGGWWPVGEGKLFFRLDLEVLNVHVFLVGLRGAVSRYRVIKIRYF